MMCSIPVLLLFQILTISPSRAYRFGLGMFDITGPAAEVNMVVMELQKRYDGIFNHSNVLLSATHTHSGPGGYFQYFLYSVTSLGFVKQNFDAMVTGIIKSVEIAKSNMMNGKIYVAKGDVLNASINRSPASYELNPAEERKRYQSNVDTEMVLLKFVNSSGHPVGMLNWFAVHATSMNMTNTLISSDNKGLAALMFEERLNGHRNVGQGPFVGAFAQANEGDVSPNLRGPKCIDTGRPCDYVHGSCNGRELFEAAKEEISGSISFTHQFVDMTKMKVQYGVSLVLKIYSHP
ncbi:Neutral/alkaline nonlysosomal ceramidase [Opisthorchis viverrini]|uniref:Neutral ceramidase n=1 Tax=Opisthorchis viverrini TaxID=6198 RepID=A0A1S8X068_OPIVI|nr:Neutral/alkaline nonlysosomal ceramidase [Opisthorchis viverrini]